MSPAQLPLESDSKGIAGVTATNTSSRKAGKTFASPDGKGLGEQIKLPKVTEDAAVDVIGSKRNPDSRLAAKEDPDATECSSSFADTTSGEENSSGFSDAEVESQLYDPGGLGSPFDGLSSFFPMRKKKLTCHWRNFIRNLTWRCKWTELKIKEIESQASKYRRHIAAYDQNKLMPFDQLQVEEFGSKSLPYTPQSHRKMPLKRRKRKRVESTTDTTTYMAHHNLFSYRAESKRSDQDGNSVADDFGNPVFPGENPASCDEFGFNNEWLVNKVDTEFQERILQKIDMIHTRVHKLKSTLDSIMTKYAGKFSSSESINHLVPCDLLNSSVRSPTFSTCNGDTVSVGGLYSSIQHMPEYDLGDFVLPDTAVSNYGEGILIPDIIESTVGLLSSADVTHHQAQVADSCEKIVDNILIHNESVGMEIQTFKQTHIASADKYQDAEISGEEESTNPTFPALEDLDKETGPAISQEQSTLKSCLATEIHFPKNKRKRGERKAGSGGWSRQLPGEPDSQ
ncbi:unnamed protein product [Coffea canephora]|uniref:Uncharacterized protein n=1 Tax=Coffea canephora TaxID=49390 RepID=A0A068UTB8_COFCA|nr:unnamed protein product [Coffea canephora]